MAYLLICAVAFGASLMTFFTGFGLGTLLLPAFALFFPTHIAVGLTAIVHLLNGCFKLFMVRSHVDRRVVLRFGVPAMLAAFAGAWLLSWLSGLEPLWSYELGGRRFTVTPVGFAIAWLMFGFALFELWPRAKSLAVSPRYLPFGGLVTGFFGGLSGHQGALRSVFLLRVGLDKKAFVATSAGIAVLIDVVRTAVYSERFLAADALTHASLLLAAIGAAFAGVLLGVRLLEKVSLRTIEVGVGVLLLLVALALGSGLL